MVSFEQRIHKGLERVDHDIEYLLACTREVLEEIGEPDLAKLLRQDLPADAAIPAESGAQVLSIAFQIMNLVEENMSNQASRALETRSGLAADTGTWGYWLKRIRESKAAKGDLQDTIRKAIVEAVLTGHPTEAKRWSVLTQHRNLYVQLVELENQMYTPLERDSIRNRIKAIIELIWRSGEILLEKPDVASERKNVLYYLREKFPVALEIVDIRFREAMNDAKVDWDPSDYTQYPRIKFGSWVGGDRDGHPFVTSAVTEETLRDLRETALDTIKSRLRELAKNMALSNVFQDPPAYLIERIHALHSSLKESPDNLEEPWNAFAVAMRKALPYDPAAPGVYQFPSELIRDLQMLAQSLLDMGAKRLATIYVVPIIRLVDTCGFHMASLDIRQNSDYHDRAMTQLMTAAGIPEAESFANWTEERRVAFLSEELKSSRPFAQYHSSLGVEAREVILSLRVVMKHIRRHGRAGIGSLIISMTRSLSDLLVAQILCREAGLTRTTEKGLVCLMPITPLFETLDDLQNSEGIMDAFLQHPVQKASLPWQNRELDEQLAHDQEVTPCQNAIPVQEAMLGYSDSNKDSGIIASQWGLFLAQQRLIAIGRKLKIGIRFFHGRGGTVSRGAGPTHRFLEALPEGSLEHGTRVTEQGEVIAQKYNNFLTGARNLELLVAGAAGPQLCDNDNQPQAAWEEAMNFLSERSAATYRALLRQEGFLPFYRQATPIDALEHSRIGSRPSRRSGKPSLKDLRAIPWVFSWNQSRFYLPGWYGVGTAVQALQDEKPDLYAALKRICQKWPFCRYVLYNIESNVESASVDMMRAYASLVTDKQIRETFTEKIIAEWELTKDVIQALLDGPLSKRRPRFYKTLHARDTWLDLLHKQQIELLATWRQSGSEDDLRRILQSINAIAAGLRTTG